MVHHTRSLLVIALLAIPAHADESVRVTLDGTRIYKSVGAQVQMDSIAWGFFSHMHSVLGDLDDTPASHAVHPLRMKPNEPASHVAHPLADLGMKPSEPAAQIIARYTREASILDEARLQKWPVADDDRNKLNAQWTGLQAERRGLLFASMIIELDNTGFDVAVIKEYLESTIRPNMSTVSVGARRLPQLIEAKGRFDSAFTAALDRAGVVW